MKSILLISVLNILLIIASVEGCASESEESTEGETICENDSDFLEFERRYYSKLSKAEYADTIYSHYDVDGNGIGDYTVVDKDFSSYYFEFPINARLKRNSKKNPSIMPDAKLLWNDIPTNTYKNVGRIINVILVIAFQVFLLSYKSAIKYSSNEVVLFVILLFSALCILGVSMVAKNKAKQKMLSEKN